MSEFEKHYFAYNFSISDSKRKIDTFIFCSIKQTMTY